MSSKLRPCDLSTLFSFSPSTSPQLGVVPQPNGTGFPCWRTVQRGCQALQRGSFHGPTQTGWYVQSDDSINWRSMYICTCMWILESAYVHVQHTLPGELMVVGSNHTRGSQFFFEKWLLRASCVVLLCLSVVCCCCLAFLSISFINCSCTYPACSVCVIQPCCSLSGLVVRAPV